MAETQCKRKREETLEINEDSKRLKPYTQVISLFEEVEEKPNQDFSSIFTALESELSSGLEPELEIYNTSPSLSEEDYERESVIKHLLEASDDELGLPNRVDSGEEETVSKGVDEFEFTVCNGLWELEDEAANYYTLLQSELFM